MTNDELHVIMLLIIPKGPAKLIYGTHPVYHDAAEAQRAISGIWSRKQIIDGIRKNLSQWGYVDGLPIK